jgi:hypothetical protein
MGCQVIHFVEPRSESVRDVLLGVTDRYRVANINKRILDPRE